jgi:hypothetical protein
VQVVDTNDQCLVANGAGTVDMSNITGVSITCIAQALQTPQLAIVRAANLSGSQEIPAVTTNANGVGGIVVIPSTTQPMPISGGITFSGLTPLAGQVNIHLAPSGNPTGNGSVLVSLVLGSDGLTAVVPPGTTIPAVLLGPLLRGELYFNVGTAANQGGEIRGPIELQGGVAVSVALLDQSQVRPNPTASGASGAGMLLADLATGKILISYITHTVNATAVAIHTSTSQNPNGASIVAFTNLLANIDVNGNNLATPLSTATLTPQNLTDFGSNLLYFEVDSTAFPNGEIRGNISPLPQ